MVTKSTGSQTVSKPEKKDNYKKTILLWSAIVTVLFEQSSKNSTAKTNTCAQKLQQ